MTIQVEGRGAYSHFGPGLYLSTSDNTDLRTNGRGYTIAHRAFLSFFLALPLAALALAIISFELIRLRRSRPKLVPSAVYTLLDAASRSVRHLLNGLRVAYRGLGIRWTVHNVLPGAALSLVLLAIVAFGGEAYIRWTAPFTQVAWPSQFVPDVGFTFTPHGVVRLTH